MYGRVGCLLWRVPGKPARRRGTPDRSPRGASAQSLPVWQYRCLSLHQRLIFVQTEDIYSAVTPLLADPLARIPNPPADLCVMVQLEKAVILSRYHDHTDARVRLHCPSEQGVEGHLHPFILPSPRLRFPTPRYPNPPMDECRGHLPLVTPAHSPPPRSLPLSFCTCARYALRRLPALHCVAFPATRCVTLPSVRCVTLALFVTIPRVLGG